MLNNHWNSEVQNKALHKSNHNRRTVRSSKHLAYYQTACQQLKSHLKELTKKVEKQSIQVFRKISNLIENQSRSTKTNTKLEVYKNKEDMQKSSEAKRSKQQT